MASPFELCSFPAVKSELAHPPETLDPGRMHAAIDEATALAERAYTAEEPEAQALAERLLYLIHAGNTFVAPLIPGVVGILWTTLMNAKLACLLGDVEELDPAQMTARLEGLLALADAQDNAAIERFTAAPDLRPITLYTKNWYSSTHGFTHQISALVQRCNGRPGFYPAFQAVLENLTEEFETIPHPELRERLPRKLGIAYSPDQALTDPDQLTEAFSLQNVRTGLASLPDPTYALGSFYSIEGVFVGVCRRMYNGLLARGFDEETLFTFKVHEGADADHAREFLDALLQCALTPRDRGRIVLGARLQLGARHEMFDRLSQVSGV